jgi:methionyl-tRNA formyltransferase
MNVAVMGSAAFGEAVLKRLLHDGVPVIAVSAPATPEGGRPDALRAAAEAAGLPVVDTATLKTSEGLARWSSFGADLCAMAFVTDILQEAVFTVPRLGTIQYHPSLLPLHRGISSMNWPIIFGDEETGLTIFWPTQGVDAGPILLQRRCPIGPDETVGSLYFDHLFPMGVDAMAEAVAAVANGTAPRIEQDHTLASYEPPCADAHAEVRWHDPAARVYALIRGCNPQPGAWTTFEGQQLRLFDCRMDPGQVAGMPGRVLRIGDDGVDIRLNGGVLRVLRVQPAGQKKIPAAEWAASAGLPEGFRFR